MTNDTSILWHLDGEGPASQSLQGTSMLVRLRAARSSALLLWRKLGGDGGNKVDLWPCIWLQVCGEGLECSQGKGWRTQCPGFRGEEEETWAGEDSYGVSQSSTEVPPLAAWASLCLEEWHSVGVCWGGPSSLHVSGLCMWTSKKDSGWVQIHSPHPQNPKFAELFKQTITHWMAPFGKL